MPDFDASLFDPSSIAPETRTLNETIVAQLESGPDPWSMTVPEMRAWRAEGNGPFPLAPRSSDAETIAIDGPNGPIELRILLPSSGSPKGALLHFHGGGWTVGAAAAQDPYLQWLADERHLAAVSVEYRLAPEHPYPQGPDDCETAALWLIDNAASRFGSDFLIIGGESAGAHLSVVTLLRLRDRHGLSPFSGAILIAGCYDLSMTPSARNWGNCRLVMNTRDVENYIALFLTPNGDASDPDVSPIHADLAGLPPALFSVGTLDMLLDDSLFMSARWKSAGNLADLKVYPGGCHVFQHFSDLPLTGQNRGDIAAFLASLP